MTQTDDTTPVLPQGTLLTLRQRGHSRSNGEDYFAVALVLAQYPNADGAIDAIVFDHLGGVHFASAYAIRELEPVGDGSQRRMVEKQSNIGSIVYHPDWVERLKDMYYMLQYEMQCKLDEANARINALESAITSPMPAPAPAPMPQEIDSAANVANVATARPKGKS